MAFTFILILCAVFNLSLQKMYLYIFKMNHLTCLYYCSGHHEVEDHHPAVTSENLCEEGGHMGPCLWTLVLLNTLRK